MAKALLVLLANEGNKPKEILDKLEETVLRKLDKKDSLWLDFKFFQALSNRSKNDCEAILEELTSIKIHKTRNDNGVISQYVSQPALGYAKLAWRHGLEVETNSPLIPKELLPIQPLEEYPIPYDFLKEH
ncbi:MAG: Imm49 family immunity protein [Bacteroidota bacterium]